MKKRILFLLFLFATAITRVSAQQDPQYSQYMFNQLVINPAYTGSRESISAVADVRQQWVSMPGAPQTGTFSMHGPLSLRSVGVGGHLVYENIGPATWAAAYADYAYRVKILNGKLALGLSTGAVNYSFRTGDMKFKNNGEVFPNAYPGAKTVFDAGAGLYYYTRTFFAGVSATHLTAPKLYDANYAYSATETSKMFFNLHPHVFLTAGYSYEVNENVVVSPSFMLKTVQTNAKTPSIDLNCNVLLMQRVWVGVSGRVGYGFAGLAQFYVNDNLRIGYSYDLGINLIGTYGQATHEIMIGYDFRINKTKALSPRLLFM